MYGPCGPASHTNAARDNPATTTLKKKKGLHRHHLIRQRIAVTLRTLGVKPVLVLLAAVSLCSCATLPPPPASPQDDPWFSNDKYLHLLVTTGISAGIARAAKNNGNEECRAALIGFSLTLTIGAAKESYDKRIKGTFYSTHDMVWDIAGSTLGSLLGSGCH